MVYFRGMMQWGTMVQKDVIATCVRWLRMCAMGAASLVERLWVWERPAQGQGEY